MNKTVERDIRKLKSDLMKKKEEIDDIRALINREVDREFQPEALDLAERELEPFIEKTLAEVKESLALKAEPETLKSHRRILGRPVLFFKRIFMNWVHVYARMILDRQNRYNRSSFDLLKVVLLRSRWSKEKLKDLEARLAECEETLAVMINRVEDIQARQERQSGPTAKK
jgi:BMFP domain-containing protein YqiC